MSRYIRLVRFSFLILIGRFVTLEGMKIKSVTPLHHPMSMGSSTSAEPTLSARESISSSSEHYGQAGHEDQQAG
jgi:hypothetical protein